MLNARHAAEQADVLVFLVRHIAFKAHMGTCRQHPMSVYACGLFAGL